MVQVSVIGFVQSIVNNFAEVDSLLWAPTSVEKNTPEWIARTLYRGSPSLRYFGYLDPTSVDAQRTVRCVQYARLGEEGITREEHRVLMDGE